MTPETDRFRTLGNRVSWLLVPYVAVAQFATLGTPVVKLVYPAIGITWLTYEAVVLLVLAAVSAPWLVRRRRELGRFAGFAMLAFTALVAYAAASAIVRPDPHVQINEEHWDVATPFLVAPLVTAWVAMLAGVGLVLAADRGRRLRVLTVAAATALVSAFAAWPLHAAATRSIRFSTGQGGAAVIHVVLLLIAALGVACLLRVSGRRDRGFGLALVGAALVGIVATQSRGALITLGVWAVLLLLALGARTPSARWVVAAALLASLVAFLFDTYLLRNFGIAVWWWAAVALVATWPTEENPCASAT